MRILVIGAGAVGGYFGGRLAQAGADVTFLVRPRRARQLARQGLVIDSPLGDFQGPVKTIGSFEGGEAPDVPDVIVLACKAYSLADALTAIAPAARPGTVILPLLNGIAHLAALDRHLPHAAVWGGAAHIGVSLDPDGRIKHLNRLQTLLFGPRSGEPPPPREADIGKDLLHALTAASVNARLQAHIEQDLWEKFVFLTALAGSTCLMRASIGSIVAVPSGEDFVLQLLREATEVASAEGFAPRSEPLSRYRDQLTEPGSPSTASMLRDLEAGAATEAEHILGDMVARAKSRGIAAPGLEIALTHLRVHELRFHRRPVGQGGGR